MGTLAEAVHRGSDGSVHYLASAPERSLLIITDPVLGVRRISFDGPCILTHRTADTGSVVYESISAKESTTITVSPGQEPSFHILIGVCTHCAFVAGSAGHDFDLWPECPFGDRVKEQIQDAAGVPLPPRLKSAPEPASEPVPRSVTSRSDAPVEPSQGTQGAPRVRVLDPQYTPASEEPVTPPELRWGGPAGGW